MKQVVTVVMAAVCVGGHALAQTSPPQPTVQKSWTDNITVKGDLRYRFERINDDARVNAAGDVYARTRDRIRARLGVEAKCNDNLKTGIELSTGQTDPISGNQTIGDGLGKKDMRLNLAYLDYNFFGDNPNEVHLIAGKMKNPFMTFPDDPVWDPDLTVEGMAVKTQFGLGLATLFANGGYTWIQERADKDHSILLSGQAAAKLQFKPEIALTVGGSYYGYQNIKGYDVIDWENKNNSYGNSTVDGTANGSTTNKAWASKFTPVVYFAELDLWAVGMPLAFYAQGLSNAVAGDYDRGQMYGVALGKSKNPRTWELGYSWAKLEKDATLGMFTDSDRWGGGTDGKGHKFYGKYQIMKGLQAGVSYFLDEKKISDPKNTKDYDRLQVDLVATL